MTDRVTPTAGLSLDEHGEVVALFSRAHDGKIQLVITDVLDPDCEQIALYGILVSDFIDHIVAMYVANTGQKETAVRKRLMKHIAIEGRLKRRDARRGTLSGGRPDKNKLN